jgi:P pilus assembly chaperone PapD
MRISFSVFLFLLLLPGVYASSFKVAPLKFSFDSKTKSTSLKLTNTSNRAVTVQLEVRKWTQKEGDDSYEPTADVVFFPKIVKIEQNEERIVRLGYRGKFSKTDEITYRIFATELPSQGQQLGALKFAFRFSMPIFVEPLTNKRVHNPDIIKASLNQGELRVLIGNHGNEHFVVNNIKVRGEGRGSKKIFERAVDGWYVLSQSDRMFAVPLEQAQCAQAELIRFTVDVDDKTLDASLPVDQEHCKRPDSEQFAGK